MAREPARAVSLTADQLAQLQEKVARLTGDVTFANGATARSAEKHTALAKAQADAQSLVAKAQADVVAADLEESQADGVVNADVAELQSFVAALSGAPPAPPPVT